MNLTDLKRQIIKDLLEHESFEGIKYINLPANLPNWNDSNIKIHKYQYKKGYISSLDMVFQIENKINYLRIHTWTGMLWNKYTISELLEKKKDKEIFADIYDKGVEMLGDEDTGYLYLHAIMEEVDLTDDFLSIPIYERIMLDFELGGFDENEIMKCYNKSIEQIIKFENEYENLKFENIGFYKDINYDVRLVNFDETENNFEHHAVEEEEEEEEEEKEEKEETNWKNIEKFFNQSYIGCKNGRVNFTGYGSYNVILKKEDKFMYVSFCIDSASCAGSFFILKTFVSENFISLWENLSSCEKAMLVKSNI